VGILRLMFAERECPQRMACFMLQHRGEAAIMIESSTASVSWSEACAVMNRLIAACKEDALALEHASALASVRATLRRAQMRVIGPHGESIGAGRRARQR
jgi:hypothetical protein